jgi:hypothetical protein
MSEDRPATLASFNQHPVVVLASRVAGPLLIALMLWLISFTWDIDRRVLVLEQHRGAEAARVNDRLSDIVRGVERLDARMQRVEDRLTRP